MVQIKMGQGHIVANVGAPPQQRVGAKITPQQGQGWRLLLDMFEHKAFAAARIEETIYLCFLNKSHDPLVKSIQQNALDRVRVEMFLAVSVPLSHDASRFS